jgi:hypothetical protein
VGVSLAILTRKNRVPIAHPLFRLFYQVEIRHRQLLPKTKGPVRGAPISQRYDPIMATLQLLNTQFLQLSRLAPEPWLQPGAPPPILANTKPIVYAIIG